MNKRRTELHIVSSVLLTGTHGDEEMLEWHFARGDDETLNNWFVHVSIGKC